MVSADSTILFVFGKLFDSYRLTCEDTKRSFFVTVEGNAIPEVHAVDNQLHVEQEAQLQGHQPAAQVPQDTPQEQHEQQNQILAQQGLPQTHQDLPPGYQDAAQGLRNLP